jgi:small subunit ribosomal protein S11
MAKAVKKVVKKRRDRKNVEAGHAHIRSTFNNTIVTITDVQATTYKSKQVNPKFIRCEFS